jgi:hypothetical protein
MPRIVPSQVVALIDRTFPENNSTTLNVGHLTVAALTGIVRLIDEIPPELLTISGEDYNNLVCGAEGIRASIAFWQQKGAGQIGQHNIQGKNALALIREALAKCPDQTPSPITAELLFITDTSLRDSIRLDISTATSAFHNGEWKAATVLAGTASEALLLWAVGNSPDFESLPSKPKESPERWHFGEYITVASKLSLIKPNTVRQATLAQNFRNLIHPGRAQRLGEVCDRATALTALAAVELIVRDLS